MRTAGCLVATFVWGSSMGVGPAEAHKGTLSCVGATHAHAPGAGGELRLWRVAREPLAAGGSPPGLGGSGSGGSGGRAPLGGAAPLGGSPANPNELRYAYRLLGEEPSVTRTHSDADSSVRGAVLAHRGM